MVVIQNKQEKKLKKGVHVAFVQVTMSRDCTALPFGLNYFASLHVFILQQLFICQSNSFQSESDKKLGDKVNKLAAILGGETSIALHLEFLIRNNHADLLILKNTKVCYWVNSKQAALNDWAQKKNSESYFQDKDRFSTEEFMDMLGTRCL